MSEDTSATNTIQEPASRAALRRARRVCVKAGTSVVANEDGRPSLTRLGAIVEQIGELSNAGVQVIFVSSGAVGMGKRLLRKQTKMSMSLKDIQTQEDRGSRGQQQGVNNNKSWSRNSSFVSLLNTEERPHTWAQKNKHYDSACAAAGQVRALVSIRIWIVTLFIPFVAFSSHVQHSLSFCSFDTDSHSPQLTLNSTRLTV
jgi:hypothetical protein